MNIFQVGDVILGRYEIVGRLGEGVFSVVFKANDLQNGGEVAVKQGKPGELADLVDLEKEFEMHKSLDPYEFSPSLIEYNEAPDHGPFMVMSVEGRSLSQRHREQDLSEATILLYLFHALTAINKLHKLGFCHCDVNIGNIAESKTNGKDRIILLDYQCAQDYCPDLAQQDIEQLFTGFQLIAWSHKRFGKIHQIWSNKKDTDIETLIAAIEDSHEFDKDASFDWK